MSTLAVLSLACLAIAAGIGTALICRLIGHQSEESPTARRAALARVSARARAQSPTPEEGYARFAGIPVVVDETVERGTLELRFGCTQRRHFVGDQATSCECGALLVDDLGDGCAVSLVGISVQPYTLSEHELARRRAQAGGDAA